LFEWPAFVPPTQPPGWSLAPAEAFVGVPGPAPAGAPDWEALGLPSVTWSGELRDTEGAPIADARVWIIPNGRTRAAVGLTPQPYAAYIGMGMEGPRVMPQISLASMPQAHTDAEGRFVLTAPQLPMPMVLGESAFGLPEPVLVVAAPGFASLTRRLDVPPASAQELGVVRLEREAIVVGRVVDQRGAGLAGARVGIASLIWLKSQLGDAPLDLRVDRAVRALLPELHETVTDTDGSFRLTGVWPANVRLWARAAGFVRGRATSVVHAAAGRASEPCILRLAPGGQVSGRVVSNEGAALTGIELLATAREIDTAGRGCIGMSLTDEHDRLPVELDRENPRAHFVMGRTDAEGRFALDGLPPGNLTLYARGLGWEPVRQRDVLSGRHDLELRLQPAARLVVSMVREEDGAPVSGAIVQAQRLTGTNQDTALPVHAGSAPHEFVVVGAGPLGTRLLVHAAGRASTIIELPGLQPDTQVATELLLAPGAHIAGVVETPEGSPRPGLAITLRAHLRSVILPARTLRSGAGGGFRFEGLPAGLFSLSVDYREARIAQDRQLVVEVTHAQRREDVQLVIVDTARVILTLLDLTGARLADCDVAVYAVETWQPDLPSQELHMLRESFQRSDSEGRVELNQLRPGGHVIVAGSNPPLTVNVTPGERRLLKLTIAAVVTGRVSSHGQPVAGAQLREVPYGPTVLSDADGRYVLPVTAHGPVTLSIAANDTMTPRELSVEVDAQRGAEFDIQLGSSVIRGVIELEAERAPDGQHPPGGQQALGERLAVEGQQSLAERVGVVLWETSSDRRLVGSAISDASGAFRFAYLDAGRYQVELDGPGGARWLLDSAPPVILAQDRTHAVTLHLSKGARMHGLVTTPDGSPVRDGYRVRVWAVGEPRPRPAVRTRAGEFLIEALAPGSYRVAIQPPGEGQSQRDPERGTLVSVEGREHLELKLVWQG